MHSAKCRLVSIIIFTVKYAKLCEYDRYYAKSVLYQVQSNAGLVHRGEVELVYVQLLLCVTMVVIDP